MGVFIEFIKDNKSYYESSDLVVRILGWSIISFFVAVVFSSVAIEIKDVNIVIITILSIYVLISSLIISFNYILLYYENIITFIILYIIGIAICVNALNMGYIPYLSVIIKTYFIICSSSILIPIIEYAIKIKETKHSLNLQNANNRNIDNQLKNIEMKLLELKKKEKANTIKSLTSNMVKDFDIVSEEDKYTQLCELIMLKYDIGNLEKYFDICSHCNKIIISLYKFETEECHYSMGCYDRDRYVKYCTFLKIEIYDNKIAFNFKNNDFNMVGNRYSRNKENTELSFEDMQKIFEIVQLVKNYSER